MTSIFRRYGFWGAIKLIISLLYTKVFFHNARLIRLPFDIRNKKYIKIGNNLTTGRGCRIEAHPIDTNSACCLELKDNIEINDYVHIAAGEKIIIGNNVLIASRVFISDINHGSYRNNIHDSPFTPPNKRALSTSPVIIEDNVWVGEAVCIMAGVKIGFGSIIGASSVVTKNIPPHSIAVGSPANVIKIFDFDRQQWMPV